MAKRGALTPKEDAFVREYLIDLNATGAAERAGYGGRAKQTGYELLRRPRVAVAVQAAIAKRAERVELSAEWVLRELMDNVRDARAAADFMAANRALELLGKHLALFPDKLNIDFRAVATMSDEELDQTARQLRLVA